MNHELIEKLAAQLGVATEVLWTALLRQAPLSSIVGCAQIVVFAACCYGLLRLTKLVWGKRDDMDCEMALIPISIGWIAAFVGVIALTPNVSYILAGFFNPEYWALREILRHLGK